MLGDLFAVEVWAEMMWGAAKKTGGLCEAQGCNCAADCPLCCSMHQTRGRVEVTEDLCNGVDARCDSPSSQFGNDLATGRRGQGYAGKVG